MNFIKRAPGDTYTLAKFFQAKSKLKNIDYFYFWSLHFNPFPIKPATVDFIKKYLPDYSQEQIKYCTDTGYIDRKWVSDIYNKLIYEKSFKPIAKLYRDCLIKNISSSTVLFGIKDHLTPSRFDPWVEERPWLINPLLEIFRCHTNKKFILMTSMENLGAYIKEPNVFIIPWGGDISNHVQHYKTVEPILDKNFESTRCFLSLNRHNRIHRIHLVSLICYFGLESNGLVSCMFKAETESNNIDSYKWQYTEETIKEKYSKGYTLIKSTDFSINDGYEIYGSIPNNNVGNFKNTLSKYYRETFVEFVAETSYTEECFLITEKTANSILGCCFPIWISSCRTVEFLRSTGMDVFDDIVDHSYDKIEDPAERLYRAVSDNLELLTDTDRTKKLWQQNRHRFLRNVEYFRKDLWNFYDSRFQSSIEKLS
jgi:hypothetical protein